MTITLRASKSTALTHDQLDGNFTDLDGRTTTIEGAYISSVNGVTPVSNAVTITTANITENTNLYYTDARARASISVTDAGGDGSLAYNSSTGVITYTGPSAAEVRAHLSAGAGITLSSGAISISAGAIKETMIDFGTGAGEVDTDNVPEGATNLYYTNARADARIAAADLDDLSNVDYTGTPTTNHVLTWDGDSWVSAAPPGLGGGEANSGNNLGASGSSVFSSKIGADLQFRKIIGTAPIVATQNTNDITLTFVPSSTVDINTNRVINVVDPVGAQDAATKAYVDSALSSGTTIFTLQADSGSNDAVLTGDTVDFEGTANEIETAVSDSKITIGLPTNVTVANDLTVGNALTVTGNLTVNGTTTTVSSTELAIDDGKIQLAVNNESSDTVDIGFVGHYYNGVRRAHAGLFRDATDKKFKLMGDYGPEPDQPTINTDDEHFELADLQLRSLEIGDTDNPSMAIRGSRLETINSNQNIEIETSGTGIVDIGANVQLKAQSDLRFADADSSNWVAFQAPATVASNVTWTLPAADAATSGFALVSDAAGALSWAAAGATTTSDTTTNAEEQIYFGDITSGAVTAVHHDADFTYNPSTGTLTSATFSGALSGNATTATTASAVAANSVALGTDTTGSYVAQGATSGNGLSGSVNSETATFTVTSNATNANTGSTIVFRDASGNFSAGTITAALTGNVTGDVSGSSGSCSGNSATATTATNVTITADNSTNATRYIHFGDATSGADGVNVDTTTLTYNPSSGTLTTGIFSGTATSAQYADLAEIYATDRDYEPGTVVMVGGEAEVTAANPEAQYLAGVISTAPAYLMNSAADGEAVALVGRVPVRVVGSINKGEAVFATHNGKASSNGQGPIVGIALETNSDLGEKSVECLLKV